jgi:hypothetical protein
LIRITKVCPELALIALLNDGPIAPTDADEDDEDNPVSPPGEEFAKDA